MVSGLFLLYLISSFYCRICKFQQFFQPVPDPREEGDYRKVFAERQDQRLIKIEEDKLRL